MGLAAWIKPASAGMEDLAEQREHARKHLAKAEEASARAREAFDADPGTELALKKALDAEQTARLHAERAERLVEQAREAEAARRRAELIERRKQLRLELAPEALEVKRAPLAKEEADALIALAQVRARRRKLESDIFDREGEAERIADQLGEEPPRRTMERFHFVRFPTQRPVRDHLERFMCTLPREDDVRHYCERLLFTMQDSW